MLTSRTRSRRREPESSLRRQVIVGVLICMGMAALLSSVWWVTRLPSLTISAVSASGGETVRETTVSDAAERVLTGSYMKLIPHRFFLWYPYEAVVEAISSIPRVKDVRVERMGRNTLRISFTEYRPYALWCSTLEEKTPCYFMDENGYAFAESPMLQGGTLIRHVKEGTTELSENQAFDAASFKNMHSFLQLLTDDLSLRVTDVYYTTENDVILRVNGGGKILMRNDGNYTRTLENLGTILTSDSFKHLEPGNFQYIDVRFGNKVFVNEELPLEETATSTGATTTSLR